MDLRQLGRAEVMSKDEEQRIVELADRLISSLEDMQKESGCRQIWLETLWLRHNMASGKSIVPRGWQLLIFKSPSILQDHPEAARIAQQLAKTITKYTEKKAQSGSKKKEK